MDVYQIFWLFFNSIAFYSKIMVADLWNRKSKCARPPKYLLSYAAVLPEDK